MKQPVIETLRLLLRPFDKKDAKVVQQLSGNKNVSDPTINIPYPYEAGMAEEWISKHSLSWKNRTSITYAITDRVSKKLLGTVAFVKINGSEAELGYWIGEPYWGRGYCTEAAKALVEFAFVHFKIEKIVAEHLSSNPASGKVMEKIGLHHINQAYILNRHGKKAKIEVYERRL